MRRDRRRTLAVAAVVLFILALTITPNGGPKDVQLRPFAAIGRAFTDPADRSNLANVPANILLFLPFGAVLAFAGVRAWRAVLVGAAFSATIEIVQLAIPGRFTSVDDVILNTTGTVLGVIAWKLYAWRRRRRAGALLQGGQRRGAGAVERGGLENR